MIRSAAWFCADHHGFFQPAGRSFAERSPDFSTNAEIPALVAKPVKYYSRMTPETRCCLFAASIALKNSPLEPASQEIGLLSTGSDGVLRANTEYFHDYLANGRTLGRGNLFIYTLPTSALGELAIALGLTGPSMFIQSIESPLANLAQIASQMISTNEAAGFLALWSDSDAAICLTIDSSSDVPDILPSNAPSSPRAYCQSLFNRVQSK